MNGCIHELMHVIKFCMYCIDVCVDVCMEVCMCLLLMMLME